MSVFWLALIAVQRDYLSELVHLNCNQIWKIDKILRLIFEESCLIEFINRKIGMSVYSGKKKATSGTRVIQAISGFVQSQ